MSFQNNTQVPNQFPGGFQQGGFAQSQNFQPTSTYQPAPNFAPTTGGFNQQFDFGTKTQQTPIDLSKGTFLNSTNQSQQGKKLSNEDDGFTDFQSAESNKKSVNKFNIRPWLNNSPFSF